VDDKADDSESNKAIVGTPYDVVIVGDYNIVGDACLGDGAEQLGQRGQVVSARIPDDACALFGSDTPPPKPGELPQRPRDPDVTGGFYQPMRAAVHDPAGNFVVAFALERITCNLANAPIDVVQDFRMRYRPNQNPKIERLLGAPEGAADFAELPIQVHTGKTATLRVRWSADSPETYPVYDVLSKALVEHREAMRVSFYATAGSFEHDRTGRAETDMDTFVDDVWTAPDSPGPVHMWAVLRDSRGGIDFASFSVDVTP
jgi:hypothetical protein